MVRKSRRAGRSERQAKSEVMACEGPLSRDDDDDVSDTRFISSFRAVPELVVLPSFKPNPYTQLYTQFEPNNFPWNIVAEPIDYAEMFTSELAKVWSGFEIDEGIECVVGDVDGAEITRRVTRYLRN